jgi:imidazolonepropionase-like amidohydrolase
MTSNSARSLGEDGRVGSLEVGKIADLVVIAGDPVRTPAEIYAVTTVYKSGAAHDAASLRAKAKGLVGLK